MAEYHVDADLQYLDEVLDFVRSQLAGYEVSPKALFQIELAVDEIFTNITSYAYNPAVGKATIRCSVLQDPLRVTLQFLDSGKPFDPLAKKEADTSREALLERTGGLGILLVRKNMDDVTYQYENGNNILTITKNLE